MGEWKKVRIGKIFNLEKGCLQSSKCILGKYDFITAIGDWKARNTYTHDFEAIVFVVGASASLGWAHYINRKFIASDLCLILAEKDIIEFLGLWGNLNNMKFNLVEFDQIKSETGYSSLTLSPKKWVQKTKAIRIISKGERCGGGVAHTDIAFEFASWISAEFKMYVIQDYKRLKSDENSKLSLGWNLNKEISKINYKIHTDAIKEYLLKDLTDEQLSYKYASEADMLNVALFNKRTKQWHEENPNLQGNMRNYASLNELLVRANMESYNAILIGKEIDQKERMIELRKFAGTQIVSLKKSNDKAIKKLEYFDYEKNKSKKYSE